MRPDTSNKPKKTVKLNRIFAIIPASSDNSTQLMEIDGVSVLERTLTAFQEFADELARAGTSLRAIVVTSDMLVYKVNGLSRYKKFNFIQNVVSGGETRMESVWKGIEALSELPFPPMDNDIIFIHDLERCLIDEDTLERCLESSIMNEIVSACVPASSTVRQPLPEVKAEPVVETPVEEPKKPVLGSALGLDLSKFPSLAERLSKNSVLGGNKAATEPAPAPVITAAGSTSADEPKPIFKSYAPAQTQAAAPVSGDNDEMSMQTPQAFRFDKLLKAYVNGIKRNLDTDDDSVLAKALNFKVHYIDGSANNIKVLTQEDAQYAEAILKNLEAEQKDS